MYIKKSAIFAVYFSSVYPIESKKGFMVMNSKYVHISTGRVQCVNIFLISQLCLQYVTCHMSHVCHIVTFLCIQVGSLIISYNSACMLCIS